MLTDNQKIISKLRLVDVFEAAEQVAIDNLHAAPNFRSMSDHSRIDWVECRVTELVRNLRKTIRAA